MTRQTRKTHKTRRAFTLTELAAIAVALAVGASLVAATGSPWTKQAMRIRSQDNLRVIGQASMVYGGFNADAIPSYSWKADVPYQIIGSPSPVTARTDSDAHAYQNTDLLRRLTGRIDNLNVDGPGTGKILFMDFRIVDKRYSHLILADFFAWGATPWIFAAPDDVNLQHWRANPLDLDSVPYGAGGTLPNGYDTDSNWRKPGIKQRWAYTSSYQWAPASWQPDESPSCFPISDTPHLFGGATEGVELGGRFFADVANPAQKVFVFEEFEWQPRLDPDTGTWVSDGTWFAYPNAHVGKLMFDGSVNDWQTGASNVGWNPSSPDYEWKQTYKVLDTFPEWKPRHVAAQSRLLPQWFRWTRDGLQGIDYPTSP